MQKESTKENKSKKVTINVAVQESTAEPERLEVHPTGDNTKARIKALKSKVHKDIIQSRSILRKINDAEDSLAAISEEERTREAFLRLKNECRVLMTFMTEHLVVSNALRQAVHTAKRTDLRVDTDADLVAFEGRFDISETLSDKDALQMAMELLMVKDDAQQRICSILLETLASDLVSSEVPENCPVGLGKLLILFRSFRSLERSLRKIELTREQADRAHQVMALQLRVETQQRELDKTCQTLSKLQSEHQQFLSESGKQHTLFRLQNTIELLEKGNRALSEEMDGVRREQRLLTQTSGELRDKLYYTQNLLKSTKAAYERDMRTVKPLVEVLEQQLGIQQMQDLTNNVQLSSAREEVMESHRAAVQRDVDVLRGKLQQLGRDLLQEQRRSEHLEAQNRQKERIVQVIVAAEMTQREAVSELKRELSASRARCEDLQQRLSDSVDTVDAMNQTTSDLKEHIDKKDKTVKQLGDLLKIRDTEVASQEVTLSRLADQVETLKQSEYKLTRLLATSKNSTEIVKLLDRHALQRRDEEANADWTVKAYKNLKLGMADSNDEDR
eukprot:gene8459-17436_t